MLASSCGSRRGLSGACVTRFCGLGLPEIDDECFGALQHCLHLRDSERPAREFREVTMAEKICERIAMLRQWQIRQACEIAQKLVRGAMCCANRKHFFDETPHDFRDGQARMALRCFHASAAACFQDVRARFRKRVCAFVGAGASRQRRRPQ